MDENIRYIPESQPDLRPEHLLPAPKWWHRFSKAWILFVGLIPLIIVMGLYVMYAYPPNDFPAEKLYTVSKGVTSSNIADGLTRAHIIRSPFLFKIFVKIFAPKSGALAGDYQFQRPENVIFIAWRIANGSYELTPIRVTIPEGLTVAQMADVFAASRSFSAFNKLAFLTQAGPYEGYLFPDTYFFLPNISTEQIIATLRKTYNKRINTLSADIETFNRPIGDVMKIASILEEEGRTKDTREIIAGILWKRLDNGMPLQVDASIVYLTGKKSGNELVADDFKTESPYNTYLNKGLPPTPISNPGLDAISAALHPRSTPYLFYLTDPQGGFWPAATYEEHLANKAKYLK